MNVADEVIVFIFTHKDDPAAHRIFYVLGVDADFVTGLPPMKDPNAGPWTLAAFAKAIDAVIRR